MGKHSEVAAQRSRNMRAIKSRNTGAEITVHSALKRAGYRFRANVATLPGCPDIVFSRHKAVVFVHGCFWHQHRCLKGRLPKSNKDYWLPKLARNVQRDRRRRRELKALGWRVLIVWGCETDNPSRIAAKIRRFLAASNG